MSNFKISLIIKTLLGEKFWKIISGQVQGSDPSFVFSNIVVTLEDVKSYLNNYFMQHLLE